jgi:hypothetical protein
MDSFGGANRGAAFQNACLVGSIGLTKHATVNGPRDYKAPISGLDSSKDKQPHNRAALFNVAVAAVRSGMHDLPGRCEDALTIVLI